MNPPGPPPSKRLLDAIGTQLVLRGMGGPAPTVGDDYEIEQILGAGGFGLICRATQRSLQRQVALKLFPLGGESDAGVRDALREARSLARLEHPGIVDVRAAGEAELSADPPLPCAYVEMQLIEGRTLRQWLDAHARSARGVVTVLLEAGRALAYAHQQGVLHRDFKPDNVMVNQSGHARVIDFGLALAADPAAADDSSDAWSGPADALGTRATRAGLVRGTPGYMAPEATQGQPRAASDQFAFAVVLRELLTGEHPFVADDSARQPVPNGAEGVYERLQPLLDRAMSVPPAERFESMDALCDAIEAALVPRRRTAWIAVGFAGLALAGVGVTWASGALGDPPPKSPATMAATATDPPPGTEASPTERPVPSPAQPSAVEPSEPVPEPPAEAPTSGSPAPATTGETEPSTDTPPSSCDDLAAWAGDWQLGTRVLWTEYSYQLDTRVEHEVTLTVEPRCAITVDDRKYPPLAEGKPQGEPVEASARSVAILEPGGLWRLPVRLAFEGDTRTYESPEHYEVQLLLDRDEARRPRLRGAFRKVNARGHVLRSGILQGSRTLAPAPRSIDATDLSCPARCRLECAGASSEQRCRERSCQAWDSDPHDICGPPSFDFREPLRARATRATVRSGRSPLERGLARGDRAMQLTVCADNARLLEGRWAIWRVAKGPLAPASRITVELAAEGCALTGTAQSGDEPEIELTGEVTYAGSWVLTPSTPTSWFPESFVLIGVGPHAPAFGVDAGDTIHRLRAHRLP